MAAVVGSSGGEGASELVTQAVALMGSWPQLGVELLAALANEAEDLDRVRQLAMVNVLLTRAREVLHQLGELLGSSAQQPDSWKLAASALSCAEAWLGLNPTTGGGCILPPGELLSQQPQLLQVLLALAAGGCSSGTSSEQVLGAAVRVLLVVFGPDNFSADEAADRAAYDALLAVLIPLRGRLGSAEALPLAGGVAQLGSAVAERAPEYCCAGAAEAVPFSELMLECLTQADPAVVESSLEFFLMVNTVPLAERKPELGPPLYEALLRRLLPHITYPADFLTWEECSAVDEDEFLRLRCCLRSGLCLWLLASCCGTCGRCWWWWGCLCCSCKLWCRGRTPTLPLWVGLG